MTTQFLLGAVNVSAFSQYPREAHYVFKIDCWRLISTGKPATAVCLPYNNLVRGVAESTDCHAYGLPPKTHTAASTPPDQAKCAQLIWFRISQP